MTPGPLKKKEMKREKNPGKGRVVRCKKNPSWGLFLFTLCPGFGKH
jgi:hypothetical protein